MIKDIYTREIFKGNSSRFQLLEVSSYLENYLWPHYSKERSQEHTLSILLMVNEKYKNGLSALEDLSKDEGKCTALYEAVVDLYLKKSFPLEGLMEHYCLFLINTFRSMENNTIRQCALRYLSLPIWEALSQSRLSAELSSSESLATHWKSYSAHKQALLKASGKSTSSSSSTATPAKSSAAKESKTSSAGKRKRKDEPVLEVAEEQSAESCSASGGELESIQRDATWIPSLLESFFAVVCNDTGSELSAPTIKYLERFAELLIDLLSQLPTRRFLKVLLDDMHFVIICRRSTVLARLESDLFGKLLLSIDNYLHFEVDDQSGEALTHQDMMERSNEKIHNLQQIAYADFPEVLRDLVFCSVGELSKKQYLLRHIQLLDHAQLIKLSRQLGVLTDKDLAIAGDSAAARNSVLDLSDEQVLWDLLIDHLVPRPRHIDDLNMMPLYPTEALLWDQNQLPLSSHYSGNDVLALPKLNLQFLSIHDYLLRNFTLFRLESAYEIRDDLTDAIKRMGPKAGLRGATTFSGWARMALPIVSVSIDEVSPNAENDFIVCG
jgi:intron-binding protein aquarius